MVASLSSPLVSSSSTSLLSFKPPTSYTFSPPSLLPRRSFRNYRRLHIHRRRTKTGICRADLSSDAPFAFAIGACVLSSLLLPNDDSSSESEEMIDSSDTRFAVMGIISFIPYFNWLGWIFAWLDTGKRRYVIYALVYLAPYIRSNMSLSPEESWLPIVSIVLGIAHVQLEASIKSGDIQGFQLFNEASKFLSSSMKSRDIDLEEHQSLHKEGRKRERGDLHRRNNSGHEDEH